MNSDPTSTALRPTRHLPPKPPRPPQRLAAVNWLLVGLLVCGGCNKSTPVSATKPPKPAASPVVLRDATAQKKLKHSYDNGESAGEFAILETIGGGVAVADFDRDGFDDLYLPSGGRLDNKQVTGLGGTLMRNQAGREFTDITDVAHSQCSSIYTHGAISGDLNNDGFADLLVTGYHAAALFINLGDGTFVEVSKQYGIDKPSWGTSAAMGDFDNDSDLDIYIAHYVDWSFENHPACKSHGEKDVCAPGSFTGLTDAIYVNNGDGSLTMQQQEIGLVENGKGLGVMVADLNQDSLVDIYVANDTTNNLLYLNKGGRFEEIGMASGTAVDDMGTPEGSMGLCCFDYDQDLLPDILVCNYENQAFALYKNDGDTNFRYVTTLAGLMALGTTYVAWGTVANDFDLDGDEDVIITNGHVMRSNPPEQLPIYLENAGGKKFSTQTFDSDSYFSKKWRGRGLVTLDIERDGDIDLLFTNVDQDAVLLENDSKLNGNWWIMELVGTQSNRDAIGASVHITTDKRKLLRSVVGGSSYLSQKPYYMHWGLPPDEKLQEVEIVWPNGQKQILKDLAAKTRHLIVQPGSL